MEGMFIHIACISLCTYLKPFSQEIDPDEKINDIITAIINSIEEICQCGFSVQSFNDIDTTAAFQCFDDSPTAVTFRGELGAALRANSSQLITYLEQWVSTTPTIVVQRSRLAVDSTCRVLIEDFNEPECVKVDSESEGSNVGPITGGVIGGVLLLLIVFIAVGVFLYYVLKVRHTTAFYSLKNHSNKK